MKTHLLFGLAICLLVASAPLTTVLLADGGAAGGEAAKTEKPPAEAKKPAASDAELGAALRRHAESTGPADTEEAPKPEKPLRPATPAQLKEYEAKLVQLENKIKQIDAAAEKLPKVEEKVSAEIAKITDAAGRPIDLKVVQQNLAEKKVTMEGRKYQALIKELLGINQQISSGYLGLYVAAHRQASDTIDYGELEGRRQGLEAALAPKYVDAEVRVADLLDRIGEVAAMEQALTRVLAVDKENVRATTYFKTKEEREKKAKEAKAAGEDDGSGSRKYGR